ncbi:MAG: hypothetical protein M3R10_03365 [Verrucomicrobiota bacterium]|nr:hypothetical protein [Verrucomicrobiota bacterium]
MSTMAVEEELRALEEGRIDPKMFPHREHVRLGFEMLRRYSFAEAVLRFTRGLRVVAKRAGHPEVYNETITVAFLALIGERLARETRIDWAEFISENDDLADKNILERWYDPSELKSAVARATFLLPRVVGRVS